METKYDPGQEVYRPDGYRVTVESIAICKGDDGKIAVTYHACDANMYEESELSSNYEEYIAFHIENFKGPKPPTK